MSLKTLMEQNDDGPGGENEVQCFQTHEVIMSFPLVMELNKAVFFLYFCLTDRPTATFGLPVAVFHCQIAINFAGFKPSRNVPVRWITCSATHRYNY